MSIATPSPPWMPLAVSTAGTPLTVAPADRKLWSDARNIVTFRFVPSEDTSISGVTGSDDIHAPSATRRVHVRE